MKIALIGYGKMGHAIEEIAMERGHSIVLKISSANTSELTEKNLSTTDVAIEFTGPHSAFENVRRCVDAGVPVVCGSTGWTEKVGEIIELVSGRQGAFLYASNFSVGVNIFFEVNKKLAAMMNDHASYEVSIEEIHHTQKKDAPSGTAITLAEQVISNFDRKERWVNHPVKNPGELSITSKRIDPAPGTHIVKYNSAIDDIEIIHTAHNRIGFASGAVLAAEFLKDKTGVFGMKEVLGL